MKLLLNPTRVVFTEDETQNILAKHLSDSGIRGLESTQIEIERSAVPPIVRSKKKELSFEEFKNAYALFVLNYAFSNTENERREAVMDFLISVNLRTDWRAFALTMLNYRNAERAWNVYQRIR